MASDFARDSAENRCAFPNRNQERVQKYNLRESYRLVSWVYACINVIAESISGVPVKFYDGPPEDEDKKEIKPEHPANKLFTPPKPMEILTREDYVKNTFICLGTWGEVFSPLTIKNNIPVNIDLVNPFQFEALKHDNGDLYAWKYTPIGKDGKTLPAKTLTEGQILQFKYFDPFNRVRGLTPLSPGRLPIEQEMNMSIWNAGFFQGGIRNPIVILLKQMLGTGTNRTNFLDQIRRDYTGFVKGHGPLVLEGGADARPLIQSIKDLDFIEGKNLTREEICALFGVPPALVGIFRYANYSNSREQTRLFWLNTLVPKMRLFRNVIQVSLLNKYWPNVYIDFDWSKVDALEADPVQKATAHNLDTSAANNLYNMGYTKEEIAAYLENEKLVGDGQPKPPPPPPQPPAQAPGKVPPTGGGGGGTEPKKPKKPAGRPPSGKIAYNGDMSEQTRTWELDGEDLSAFAEHYQKTILEPFASEYLLFVKTFAKQVIAESKREEPINHLKWQGQWKHSVESFVKRVLCEGVRQAAYEATDREKEQFKLLDPMNLVAADKPQDSINYFVNESANKSLLITGLLSGVFNSPSANKLLENPDAFIIPIMNIEEARWVAGRVYHHGKMLGHAELGVTRHTWASHNCPVHNEGLQGATVAHWADFPDGAGIHPMSKDSVAPLKACTCTTHPSTVVVKLSTQ